MSKQGPVERIATPIEKIWNSGAINAILVFFSTGVSWISSGFLSKTVFKTMTQAGLLTPGRRLLFVAGSTIVGSIMGQAMKRGWNKEDSGNYLEEAIKIGVGWGVPLAGYFFLSLNPIHTAALAAVTGAVTCDESVKFIKRVAPSIVASIFGSAPEPQVIPLSVPPFEPPVAPTIAAPVPVAAPMPVAAPVQRDIPIITVEPFPVLPVKPAIVADVPVTILAPSVNPDVSQAEEPPQQGEKRKREDDIEDADQVKKPRLDDEEQNRGEKRKRGDESSSDDEKAAKKARVVAKT